MLLLLAGLALTLLAQRGLDAVAFSGRGQPLAFGLLALSGAGLWLAALWRARPAPPAEEILPGVALVSRLGGRTLTLKLQGPGVTPELHETVRAVLAGLDPR